MIPRYLYERWLAVAREQRNEVALVHQATARRWTFAQLWQEGEAGDLESGMSFPSGMGPEFVLEVLRGWRGGRITCPLERGVQIQVPAEIPRECAHLKMTSATGGTARFVAFTEEQLAADAANIVSTMGLRRDWPNLACISLAHSYGFSNLITPLLLHGIPLVLVEAPLPELLMRAAEGWDGVTLPAVPALWRTWLETKSIPKNIRLAISAGAPLPLALERAVYEMAGTKIHNFYGSSECGGIAYDRSERPRQEANFAGTAMEHVQLSVSEAGTLMVDSAAVGLTYLPEGQANLSRGHFETSDIVSIEGEGRLFLHGRASDVINVAGRKVLPETVEHALRLHPAVRECAVFGVPNAERFETIVACVKAEGAVHGIELARHLSTTLPGWQIPRQWWFTADLEPNARGKISRAEWKRKYLEKTG